MQQLELPFKTATQRIKPMVNKLCYSMLDELPDLICWDDWVDDECSNDYSDKELVSLAKDIAWEQLTESGLDRCSANHHIYGYCGDAEIYDCCDGGES
jgi:hypothetical protein